MSISIFEASPGKGLVVLPEAGVFPVVAVSNDFIQHTGILKAPVLDHSISELFQSPHLLPSLELVLKQKLKHELPPQPYELKQGGKIFTWKLVLSPVLSGAEVSHIIITAEEALSSSEKRIADLHQIEKAYHVFMQAPLIVGILRGSEYRIELANADLLEVWGRDSGVIGKRLLEAIPELETQGLITLLDQVRETGESFYAYEFPIILNRGGREETMYFDFVYKAVYDEGDHKIASAIISVGMDVTGKVDARKKMEESETKYQELFNSLDQGFCLLEVLYDEAGKPVDYLFLETNRVFEKQTGLLNANGKRALELVPNLEQHWIDLYSNVAITGEAKQFVEGSAAMGRWFDVYAFRMGGEDSRKVALLFTDVTEKRKSEEALRQSERNLRNTILQAPVSMSILKGEDFVVEIANEKMFELWGRGSEELLGKPLFVGLPEVREQGFEELLQQVYRSGNEYAAYATAVTLPRDGQMETVFCNFLYTPFREGDGSISGIIVVATEVTRQVKARQEIEDQVKQRTLELAKANDALVHSNQELQRSNANLEEFAYAASHDLKEPMRKIQLFSDRLKEGLQDRLGPDEKNYFDRILFATQRMNTLIDDLLMYSHVSRGATLEENVDLNQKVRMVLSDLELEIEEKKASVLFNNLPVIKGHRRQIQQLFQNLIGNAIKYSKPGVAPEIRIESGIVEDNKKLNGIPADKLNRPYHLITVTDNGIGFEQEDADRIFNVFTRLHGNAEYKGTGVGLSIARKVVQNHGGYIWAESEPGKGSKFKVLLPAES